jgi:hypothetical protein
MGDISGGWRLVSMSQSRRTSMRHEANFRLSANPTSGGFVRAVALAGLLAMAVLISFMPAPNGVGADGLHDMAAAELLTGHGIVRSPW